MNETPKTNTAMLVLGVLFSRILETENSRNPLHCIFFTNSNHRLWKCLQIKSRRLKTSSNQSMLWFENQIKFRHNCISDPKLVKIRSGHNIRYKDPCSVISVWLDSSRRDLFNGAGIMKTLWDGFDRTIFLGFVFWKKMLCFFFNSKNST